MKALVDLLTDTGHPDKLAARWFAIVMSLVTLAFALWL